MSPRDSRWHPGIALGSNSKFLSAYFSKRGTHFSLCSATVVCSKLHLLIPGLRIQPALKNFLAKKFLKSTLQCAGIMWPPGKVHLSNFGPPKFFSSSVFARFLAIFSQFLILYFRLRALEWAPKTLDDIQGQNWGQTQSFSPQIFQNLAPTSAYVVLLY